MRGSGIQVFRGLERFTRVFEIFVNMGICTVGRYRVSRRRRVDRNSKILAALASIGSSISETLSEILSRPSKNTQHFTCSPCNECDGEPRRATLLHRNEGLVSFPSRRSLGSHRPDDIYPKGPKDPIIRYLGLG